jgi:hypothetical protein
MHPDYIGREYTCGQLLYEEKTSLRQFTPSNIPAEKMQ